MKRFVGRFAQDEEGAVTVDWVLLTGAIVTLGFAVLSSITDASVDLSGRISAEILSVEP